MTFRKGLSVYVPQALLEEHGEQIITQPFAKGYLSAGYILTLNLDPRAYLFLAKPHDATRIRLCVYKSDLLLLKAYEHFEKIGQPELYWTTIFDVGFKAVEENRLISVPTSHSGASAVNTASFSNIGDTTLPSQEIPYSTLVKDASRDGVSSRPETVRPAAYVEKESNSSGSSIRSGELTNSTAKGKHSDLSSLSTKTKPIRLRRKV